MLDESCLRCFGSPLDASNLEAHLNYTEGHMKWSLLNARRHKHLRFPLPLALESQPESLDLIGMYTLEPVENSEISTYRFVSQCLVTSSSYFFYLFCQFIVPSKSNSFCLTITWNSKTQSFFY